MRIKRAAFKVLYSGAPAEDAQILALKVNTLRTVWAVLFDSANFTIVPPFVFEFSGPGLIPRLIGNPRSGDWLDLLKLERNSDENWREITVCSDIYAGVDLISIVTEAPRINEF